MRLFDCVIIPPLNKIMWFCGVQRKVVLRSEYYKYTHTCITSEQRAMEIGGFRAAPGCGRRGGGAGRQEVQRYSRNLPGTRRQRYEQCLLCID